MAITPEQLEELEAKHVRIAHIQGRGDPAPWEIVIRKPTRAEYKMFRARSNNPTTQSDATEHLVRQLAVYPVKAELDAMLEDWPGIGEACGKSILDLAGVSAAEDIK